MLDVKEHFFNTFFKVIVDYVNKILKQILTRFNTNLAAKVEKHVRSIFLLILRHLVPKTFHNKSNHVMNIKLCNI